MTDKINDIAWIIDDLSEPESHGVDKFRVDFQGTNFMFIHDRNPNRWYIRRFDKDVTATMRTIVYPSRNAPALRAAWKIVEEHCGY